MSHIDQIKVLCNGKIVISSNKNTIIPLFCPLCKVHMKTSDDVISYEASKTCNKCESRWEKSSFGNWKEGWRPSQETDGWIEYLEERKLLSRPVFNLG